MFSRIRDIAATAYDGLFGAPYGFFDQMEQAGALPSVEDADVVDFSVFLRDIGLPDTRRRSAQGGLRHADPRNRERRSPYGAQGKPAGLLRRVFSGERATIDHFTQDPWSGS